MPAFERSCATLRISGEWLMPDKISHMLDGEPMFMGTGNDGISLLSETLQALGERGIELALNIYDSTE